ncbi:MAG: PD-(D/E)XK nuclease domain-containing protein, partial [Chlamydiia bacterium]|nr:PD-(D/E)XK nuclease domain-containing protein [Chlamydiia bacterium]
MVSLDGTTATEEELMNISFVNGIDLTALMYQTGYFTIKGFHSISKRYQLGLPNEEVRSAFITSLVKNFTGITQLRSSEELIKALENCEIAFLFKHLELGLSSFAYQVFVDAKERTYQGMLLAMLYGMGFDPLSERSTNRGRIDVVLEIPKTTYILELKLNDTADNALKQIYEKEYFKPYLNRGKHIVIVGANFSSELRNISDWKGAVLTESGEKVKDLLS